MVVRTFLSLSLLSLLALFLDPSPFLNPFCGRTQFFALELDDERALRSLAALPSFKDSLDSHV